MNTRKNQILSLLIVGVLATIGIGATVASAAAIPVDINARLSHPSLASPITLVGGGTVNVVAGTIAPGIFNLVDATGGPASAQITWSTGPVSLSGRFRVDGRAVARWVDARRAYFNAVVDEETPVFVKLPPEDPEHGRRCGRSKRHLYGTRGAAAGWEDEYSEFLKENGFQRGLASGCLFYHPGRDLRVVVYGDDFTIVGSCQEIDWYESTMEAIYAITKIG